MPRLSNSIAVVALLSVGGWLTTGPVDAATPVTGQPAATFSFPVHAPVSYATTDGWSVRWSLSLANVASQRLIDRIGNANASGTCRGSILRLQVVHEAVTSPVDLNGQAHHCHRFRLELLDRHGAVLATAHSGILLTLTSFTGGQELFQPSMFSSQRTPFWCVGASVQMMLNMMRGERDHSVAGQRTYMTYARLHDQATGLRGTNPLGWRATLNRYAGGTGYHVRVSGSLQAAIRSAARRLRVTGRPVGLLVMRGHHAWVMSGFRATADPAMTNHFTVTAVYVEGPLYPIHQSDGFDLPPDSHLTVTALHRYMKSYDAPGTSWQHRYVTVEP